MDNNKAGVLKRIRLDSNNNKIFEDEKSMISKGWSAIGGLFKSEQNVPIVTNIEQIIN